MHGAGLRARNCVAVTAADANAMDNCKLRLDKTNARCSRRWGEHSCRQAPVKSSSVSKRTRSQAAWWCQTTPREPCHLLVGIALGECADCVLGMARSEVCINSSRLVQSTPWAEPAAHAHFEGAELRFQCCIEQAPPPIPHAQHSHTISTMHVYNKCTRSPHQHNNHVVTPNAHHASFQPPTGTHHGNEDPT